MHREDILQLVAGGLYLLTFVSTSYEAEIRSVSPRFPQGSKWQVVVEVPAMVWLACSKRCQVVLAFTADC
jgi:hypothetical protein